MKKFLTALLAFSFLVLFAPDAFAAQKPVEKVVEKASKAPTRDSLVSFWEEKNLADDEVKQFEKTGEKGVYKFETSFFPYQGRLRLLNTVITKSSDANAQDLYTGIIEVELVDVPEDFFTRYAASYGAWLAQNYFYYDSAKSEWFPASEWNAYIATAAAPPPAQSCAPASGSKYTIIIILGALGVLLALLAVYAVRQNRKIWANHDKALQEQQRGLKIAEESLDFQKEHTKLLKEIAASLKKK